MGNKDVLQQRFLEKLKIRARETLRIDPEKEWGIQRRIAKELRISESVVQRWFAGAFPTAEYLLKIKEVFGLSIDEILSGETSEQVKSLPSPIEFADLVGFVEAGLETEDFVSFPIQIFGSTIQGGGQSLGQVIIHKRVFGKRKNLVAVQLNGGKEIKVVIVGK